MEAHNYGVCNICSNEYDDDPSVVEDKSTSHLPVQSSNCAHFMCFSCVVNVKISKAEREGKEPRRIKWLECPECRRKTCFNSEAPIVSIMVCEMLKGQRAQRAPNNSTPKAHRATASLPFPQDSSGVISASESGSQEREGGRNAEEEHTTEQRSVRKGPVRRSNVAIKREITCVNDILRDKRQYGNRFLVGRHNPIGIMKLGGNSQSTHLTPRADHPRLQTSIGDIDVVCYNDIWQSHFAPQYAGQEVACLDWVPSRSKDGTEFAIFMRRSRTNLGPEATSHGPLLGWEYCGNYKASKTDIEMTESAQSFAPVSKRLIAKKTLKSANNGGYGRRKLDYYRAKLDSELRKDKTPAGPLWMIEKRRPTDEERKEGRPPLAARARALQYHKNISDKDLSRIVVELDESYDLIPIEFVRYQEEIYDYVKGGKTDRDKNGKKFTKGHGACKAQDWYDFLDTQIFN